MDVNTWDGEAITGFGGGNSRASGICVKVTRVDLGEVRLAAATGEACGIAWRCGAGTRGLFFNTALELRLRPWGTPGVLFACCRRERVVGDLEMLGR